MCSPEDSIPRDVLLAKLSENEVSIISNKAKELFLKNSDTLTKSGELDELQLSKSEMQLLSSIAQCDFENIFSKGSFVRKIYFLYSIISNRKESMRNSEKSVDSCRFFPQISKLSNQIDLYLLWILFDLIKTSEPIGYIPLKPSVVLKLYAKCCDVAIKNGMVAHVQQEKLAKCRDFFCDSAEWISSPSIDWPSKMKKRYLDFGKEIQTIKKAIKQGWNK